MAAEELEPVRASRRPHERSAFARLARAHGLAMAGDALVTMALAGSLFFSIPPTAARGRVALSLVLTMAPFAIVAPFLGPAIDRTRWGRRAVVVACGIGRAAAAVAMAQVLDSLLLFPAALASLVLSKAYSVAKSALVPSAVRDDSELVEANSKLAITGVVAGLAAAIPGVAVLRLLDAQWALWLAAATFVVSAVAAVTVEEHRSAERHVRGTAVARWDRGLIVAAAAMAVLRASVGFLSFLVAFEFRRPPGRPAWWFGVALGVSMVANLLGAALAPRVRRLLAEERVLSVSLAAVAIVCGVLVRSAPPPLVIAAVAAAAVGFAAAVAKLAFDAIVQRDTEDASRATVFARAEATFQLLWVVGALIPVAVGIPLRGGVAFLAVVTAATVLGTLVDAYRRRPARGGPVA